MTGHLHRPWLRTLAAGALALVSAGAPLELHAQAQAGGRDADLTTIKTLKCTFSVSSRLAWKNGVPEPTIRNTGLLTLDIKEISAAGGLAVLTNTAGNHDVTAQVDGDAMHFLEVSRGGRIAVTTVFAEYSVGSKLRAVHSRADYLPIDLGIFKSDPEVGQYYGDCEATR